MVRGQGSVELILALSIAQVFDLANMKHSSTLVCVEREAAPLVRAHSLDVLVIIEREGLERRVV